MVTSLAFNLLAGIFPDPLILASGWYLQATSQVTVDGPEVSKVKLPATGCHTATVPGTVLTTLVNDQVFPEPLYGENNRPDKIPESLCRDAY